MTASITRISRNVNRCRCARMQCASLTPLALTPDGTTESDGERREKRPAPKRCDFSQWSREGRGLRTPSSKVALGVREYISRPCVHVSSKVSTPTLSVLWQTFGLVQIQKNDGRNLNATPGHIIN